MPATAKREKPILFSGTMVRAILDGRKTQTRRVVSEMHNQGRNLFHGNRCRKLEAGGWHFWSTDSPKASLRMPQLRCPFGGPGDRLWVREAFRLSGGGTRKRAVYKDGAVSPWQPHSGPIANTLWRPSIHMPRWASRITLEIKDVRVQRVQEIDHRDAVAEGVEYDVSKEGGAPIPRFQKLWDSINSKSGHGWEENPWVWAITFRRVEDEP